MKRIVLAVVGLIFAGFVGVAAFLFYLSANLPQLMTIKDYKPLVVSEVFDSHGEKIGEFFREKRIVVPVDKIPEKLINAFVAAEDDTFFQHSGINYIAIVRAFIANVRAGKKVQGGSTITQQVARSLLLTPEKTYTRKIKEVLLSYKMETNLSKKDIMYLYLNQIYLGEGAYGVTAAARVYYRKDLKDLKLSEMAILAGLPQAPSRYSPLDAPSSAKARQKYVLGRMETVGFISQKEHDEAVNEPITVYARQKYREIAPYFVETIRQQLVKTLGESKVLDEGIRIETGLNKKIQLAAQEQVAQGLRELDKRQGYRGALKNVTDVKDVADVLLKTRNKLMDEASPELVVQADGTVPARGPLNLNPQVSKDPQAKKKNLPDYVKLQTLTEGVVTQINDKWGVVTVRFAESQGAIDLETMKWARKPNPEVRSDFDELTLPSKALKVGDVIMLKVVSDKFQSPRLTEKLATLRKNFARVNKKGVFELPKDFPQLDDYAGIELEQEPLAEGALLSFDLKSQDILAMVGGYAFERNEFNRALQATRQTGSSFKPIAYTAALDNGFSPNRVIIDAPIVYEFEAPPEEGGTVSADGETKKWKPGNYGKTFGGDVLFRNALISSLNIPTVKIMEETSVPVVADYAKRLGIFSPLNMDLGMGLGSSSVTLYEMTKVFAHFGRLGKRIYPVLIRKVKDQAGAVLLENMSLDSRFENETSEMDADIEERRLKYLEALAQQATDPNAPAPNPEAPVPTPSKKKTAKIFFDDKDLLISPQTAYLMTSLLRGVIFDPGGTGGAAKEIGRPAAGKTGTTSSYYDTWFLGYTPQIVTGVWAGYDSEKSLGVGETGGKTALPIWLRYMMKAHEDLPRQEFPTPDKIVFANIDNVTGKLASASSKVVVRQAFLEGTEPTTTSSESSSTGEDKDFLKDDLSQ